MNDQDLAQNSLQEALLSELAELRTKNPAFSLRAYANRLGVSSGALSGIINGHRQVSKRLCERLLNNMSLTFEQEEKIKKLFSKKEQAKKQSLRQSPKSLERQQLTVDQFQVIADTIHYSLLSLFETKDFQHDFDWMAARLNRSVKEVKQACERLYRLGMLDKKVSEENLAGTYKLTGQYFRTTNNIASSSIRRFHQQSLQEAEQALFEVPLEKRDMVSRTFAIDTQKLAEAKEIIREFRDKMSDVLITEENDEVYKLNIQLFPMTQGEEK